MKKIVLEILVDRLNEKGAGAFEYILIVLHKVLEKKPGFWERKKYERPSFSLEISKIGNKIRFFFVSPEEYTGFIKNQIYAHYSNVEINEIADYMTKIPDDKIIIGKVYQEKHFIYPIKNFTEIQESSVNTIMDPYSSLTSAINKISANDNLNIFQVNFSPIWDKSWKKDVSKIYKILSSKLPKQIKKILLSPYLKYLKILLFPFFALLWLIKLFINRKEEETPEEILEEENKKIKGDTPIDEEEKNIKLPLHIKNKLVGVGYSVDINIIFAGENKKEGKINIKEIFNTLGVYSFHGSNGFRFGGFRESLDDIMLIKTRKTKDDLILNTKELSGLVHLPTTYVKTPAINWVLSRSFEPPSDLPLLTLSKDITPIGKTNFRGINQEFGIGVNDRRRHMYIIGKTGMGKSTLLENMIVDDIKKGRGVGVIDPHGDLAENIIGLIPKNRTNQVIIFDPSDINWPIAFNMLENVSPEHRPLVASGLVGIFKKIFGDSWGPRLEHILRNTILALLEYPDTTLISIPMMLTSEVYRSKVVNKVKDPVVRKFWTGEFAKMAPNQKVEASGPILNKVGQFLSSTILRNVLGQVKNTFDIRWAMDNGKIVILNLSKGKIGEDASSLLGAMMVTKFQMAAMSRSDIPEKDRKDFYLYVDEFQNFATDSFATILSEARKYKLNLVMANQYIDQMTEEVKGAVFGNVGTLVSFQVGYHDANILKDVFGGDITEEDLTNLRKYSIYSKLLTDGMPSPIFSADTFSPYFTDPVDFSTRYDKILKVSREKYAKPKNQVESKINSSLEEIEKQENLWEKKKEQMKSNKK